MGKTATFCATANPNHEKTKTQHNFSGNKRVKMVSENFQRNKYTTEVAAEIDLKYALVSIHASKLSIYNCAFLFTVVLFHSSSLQFC